MGFPLCWWLLPWKASWWMHWMLVHLRLWVLAKVLQFLLTWNYFFASTIKHKVGSCWESEHALLDFRNAQAQWLFRSWRSKWSSYQGVLRDRVSQKSMLQVVVQVELRFFHTWSRWFARNLKLKSWLGEWSRQSFWIGWLFRCWSFLRTCSRWPYRRSCSVKSIQPRS